MLLLEVRLGQLSFTVKLVYFRLESDMESWFFWTFFETFYLP